MQLFSKRNEKLIDKEESSFLKESLRNRLLNEIKYISSTDEFLERCFLVEDERNSCWYLDDASIKRISSLELGYDMTNFFKFKDFSLVDEGDINDYVLFDLIEILLIFSKEKSRELVRERFQKHFSEEGNEFKVYDFLITQKNMEGIRPYVSFIKDKLLKEKLAQFYVAEGSKDYGLLAKISADILQFLFSGFKKKDTKNYTAKLVEELAKKSIERRNVQAFTKLLDNVIINAKALNNEIANIRHTDRSTFLVDNPTLFKLIVANNIYLSELVIFAAPEKYFFSQKAIDFKKEYIDKYKIPSGWVIKNPRKDEDEIKLGDIPF